MVQLAIVVRERAPEDGSVALSASHDADLLFEGGRAKDLHISCGEPRCGRGWKRGDLSLRDICWFCDGIVPVGEDGRG